MRTSWKLGSLLTLGLLVAGSLILGTPEQATARPQYQKQFNEMYPGLKELAAEQKCNVCHYGTGENSKKNRNNYATDLAKALGEKNVKGVEDIQKALKATEAGKSAVEGKTYKDLIEGGQLPSNGWTAPE